MATAWTVNSKGEVWTLHPQGGGQLMAPAESALQVALGFDGIPWIVSTKRGSGAGNLVQYYYGNSGWQTLPPTICAVQVAGSTNNFCWLVDENNAVWAVDIHGTADRMSPDGFALQVGVGNFGPPWAIGTQSYETGGGNEILFYNQANGQWTPVPAPAAGVQIAGQYDNSAWVVTSENSICNVQMNGVSQLMSPAGTALQVGIGPDKMPWMISTQSTSPGGNQVMYWANGAWTAVAAPAAAVWVAGSM
ncbi:MAG: hypothetical protein JNK87_38745 [Bryobacterales bacterium]|nr:hypothetical protein [Bryobacterales bacterium]